MDTIILLDTIILVAMDMVATDMAGGDMGIPGITTITRDTMIAIMAGITIMIGEGTAGNGVRRRGLDSVV